MSFQQTDEERYAALDHSLTNHTPSSVQIERIEEIRALAKGLGHSIIELSSNSRERSVALTHLEDCVMWAVKGIVLVTPDG